MKKQVQKGYPMTAQRWKQLCEYLAEVLKVDDTNPEAHDPQYIIWKCDQTMKHTLNWMYDHKIRDVNKEVSDLKRFHYVRCDCTVWLNKDEAAKWLARGMPHVGELQRECECCGEIESFFTPLDHMPPEERAEYNHRKARG